MSTSSLSSAAFSSSSSSTASSLSSSSSSSSPKKPPRSEEIVPEAESSQVLIHTSPNKPSASTAGEKPQPKPAVLGPAPTPQHKGAPGHSATSSGLPSLHLSPTVTFQGPPAPGAGSKEPPEGGADLDPHGDEKGRPSRSDRDGDGAPLNTRASPDPKISDAWKLYENQREAFIQTVFAGPHKVTQQPQKWTVDPGNLFDTAAKNLDFQQPLKLVQLYKKNVDPRLHGDVDRMLKTLSFYVAEGVTAEQLQELLDRTETWQSGRVWGQGLTVFTTGFFLLGAYQYINAQYGNALVRSSDPERLEIEKFIWGCLIAGFGGVFGSNVIGKGGLQPNYFTPLAFDREGKAYKDGKAIDFTSTWRGKFTEYVSFWGFGVGHSVVEAMFKDRPKELVAKAAAKWASACAATLATCLTKQLLPRVMLARDSMLLDASTPLKREAIRALLDKPSTQEGCADFCDYMSAFAKGLKANIALPSAPELARALLHSLSVGVALSPMLASRTYPKQAYELALTGSIWIGVYWGLGSRVARATIDQIKQAGAQEAARTQERSQAAANRERVPDSKHAVNDHGDEEQGTKPQADEAVNSPLEVAAIVPPPKRRCSPCNACVIV